MKTADTINDTNSWKLLNKHPKKNGKQHKKYKEQQITQHKDKIRKYRYVLYYT